MSGVRARAQVARSISSTGIFGRSLPGASAAFNPLEEIRLDTLLAIPDVQNMAAMLVDPNGKGLEDHWSKAAFAMLLNKAAHLANGLLIFIGGYTTASKYPLVKLI